MYKYADHDATVATSKVGVVKLSVGVVGAKSSSLVSESGDLLRDSISESWAMYLVNSSKLTLPSSSVYVCALWTMSVVVSMHCDSICVSVCVVVHHYNSKNFNTAKKC